MSARRRKARRRARAVPPRHVRTVQARRSIHVRAPESFWHWLLALRTRHARVLIQHPHHYAVAVGLTLFLFAIGHAEAGGIAGAWGYALLENLCSATEEVA